VNVAAARAARIREILERAFTPSEIEVTDESHLHVGHAGAASGKGHFSVTIVANAFAEHTAIDRHRMIYSALSDMMDKDIHALRIKALTPREQ